jgi:uncharacterized protein YdhG (YjbR/CyaY superfamily)
MKPSAVDAYLAAQPPKARAALAKIRALARKIAPRGTEGISYGIPTVRLDDRILVHYAGFKEHVSMFPPVRDPALLKRLKPYEGPKGNLKFPLDAPLPMPLIGEVVRWHLARLAAIEPATKKPPAKKIAKKPPAKSSKKTVAKPAKKSPRKRP